MSLHYEHITRGAARALGHAAASWAWDESQYALVGTSGMPELLKFAPLLDGGDAFTLEAILRLDVTYKTNGKHTQLLVCCPSRSGNMTYTTLVSLKATASTAMRERMRAVTQFAAILDNLGIAEDS